MQTYAVIEAEGYSRKVHKCCANDMKRKPDHRIFRTADDPLPDEEEPNGNTPRR